jgi:DNA-binding response OmpR family regulator
MRVLWPSATKTTQSNEVTLAQFIAHLRHKVPALRDRLKTVWGLGFRME